MCVCVCVYRAPCGRGAEKREPFSPAIALKLISPVSAAWRCAQRAVLALMGAYVRRALLSESGWRRPILVGATAFSGAALLLYTAAMPPPLNFNPTGDGSERREAEEGRVCAVHTKPYRHGSADCNPLVGHCSDGGEDRDIAWQCMLDPPTRTFCGYAGIIDPARDFVDGAICAATAGRVSFALPNGLLNAPNGLLNARVSLVHSFVCFTSIKDAGDRLCIPRVWHRSIDCIEPGTSRPQLLAHILEAGSIDFTRAHGRSPRFQCFHRGGYGSVGWLHLHSFDDSADHMCPASSSSEGKSPNPHPRQYVCAEGSLNITGRVEQMLRALSAPVPAAA